MKRVFIALLIAMAIAPSAFSQTYVYSVTTGSNPYVSDIRSGGVLVYPAPKEDELSSWQPMPFPWKLYDKEVTGYYISDNGYITFDSLATVSYPKNTALPTTAEPNNAIYAFWNDFHLEEGNPLWTNEVRTMTVGTEPDRIHVIMWIGVVPKGVSWSSSDNLSFAIVLYEQGDFDIVFVSGRKTMKLAGTIGVECADGQYMKMVPGSPSLDYPSVTPDPEDDINYKFTFTNRRYDAALLSLDLPRMSRVNTPVQIKGKLKNLGSDVITSFDLSYQVEKDPAKIQLISGLSLRSNEEYTFTHNVQWTPSISGKSYVVKAWVSNLNDGIVDENPGNNFTETKVFVNKGITAEKRTIVEEFTGAWCGWCPDGAWIMGEIEQQHPNAVLVSIHAGGTDAMITTEGAEYARVYNPGYPQAMIDRIRFSGQTTVPINRTGNAWMVRTSEQLNAMTPAALKVDRKYEASNRKITATVTVDFIDAPYPGDLRMNLFIVEDSVSGPGTGYDQVNYYSSNESFPNHPYYGQSNPIQGFVHRHVLRAVPSDVWGTEGVIPSNPGEGSSFSQQYTYTLPSSMNEKNISLVGFVSYYDPDYTQREVLNAVKIPLFEPVGVKDVHPTAFSISEVFPNPLQTLGYCEIILDRTESVSVELYNSLGQKIRNIVDGIMVSGRHVVSIKGSDLNPGVYFLRFNTQTRMFTRTFVITR